MEVGHRRTERRDPCLVKFGGKSGETIRSSPVTRKGTGICKYGKQKNPRRALWSKRLHRPRKEPWLGRRCPSPRLLGRADQVSVYVCLVCVRVQQRESRAMKDLRPLRGCSVPRRDFPRLPAIGSQGRVRAARSSATAERSKHLCPFGLPPLHPSLPFASLPLLLLHSADYLSSLLFISSLFIHSSPPSPSVLLFSFLWSPPSSPLNHTFPLYPIDIPWLAVQNSHPLAMP